ncbi:hypothetical protein MPL1_04677 [Methylophaga lonarensis MPL]|uniref:Uncharacterized protein n=1 Tax=Methylophaga lonarensis MPL TaxID=1286106 RepID=M7P209_9GAMM|nr:dimethylamine monooxygenase subunit DmmA family protein [Methylophaga lonarensis]EMR13507.1 hypothetical protein MPL1_04677 [Methylophaga lonarensis MPL]
MQRGYWIRSKPIYGSLVWQSPAAAHLVIAAGEGGIAVLKLFQQMYPREPIQVLYAGQPKTGRDYAEILGSTVPEGLQICNSEAELLETLKTQLGNYHMGTQFYVAGPEAFLWQVMKSLGQVGVQDADVHKELAGTLARPVYCVHCKTITEAVHHNIFSCSHCGRKLFVRDHFSRRLGAYMGLMVDAEQPGNIPKIEEVYP